MIDKLVRDIRTPIFESVDDVRIKFNYFREISKRKIDKLNEQELNVLVTEFKKFMNYILAFWSDSYPSRLWRVSINKNINNQSRRLSKISEIIGPPTDKAKINRCNLDSESVFYSALDLNTAFWETMPKVGDDITVSEWKIKNGKQLNLHHIFHPFKENVSKESQEAYEQHLKLIQPYEQSYKEIHLELIAFACDEFMKAVANDKKVNYLFSAIISSQLLQQERDANGFRIDSISYPCTKKNHSVTNVAILNSLFLEKLDLLSVTMSTVTETNYDIDNPNRTDLVRIAPIQLKHKFFNLKEDRIIYDEDDYYKQVQYYISLNNGHNSNSE